jgi:bifunctional DNA-binding transcriptional regulator/antitoxin component of YhaV-PrlF toxin-antitoxin module
MNWYHTNILEIDHMEDLVLIKKVSRAEVLENTRTGRPPRATFSLRLYANACLLAIPVGLCNDGDRADFYLSKSGFAVEIGPDCSRSISGRRSTRTASLPAEVREALAGVAEGSHSLICDERPDRMYFFPFSQFAK